MDLFGANMRLPETKLVLWDVFCYLQQFHQAGKQNSLKKTLEKVGSRLIGRYESICVGDVPALWIITMRARFHCLGTLPKLSMALNIFTRESTHLRGRNLAVRLSML